MQVSEAVMAHLHNLCDYLEHFYDFSTQYFFETELLSGRGNWSWCGSFKIVCMKVDKTFDLFTFRSRYLFVVTFSVSAPFQEYLKFNKNLRVPTLIDEHNTEL